MILHSNVEQVMTMCRVQKWQLSLSYFLSYFPLIVSDAISCPLHNLKTLWYIIMILYSNVETGLDDVSRTRMATLAFIFSELFPLIVSDAISCPLHNLKTVWYYIMILKELCRTDLDTVSRTRVATLAFILSELFPLDCFRCNFVSAP